MFNIIKTALALTFIMATASPSDAGELYKIVHPDGTITYTDKAVKGAIKVTTKTLNAVKTTTPKPVATPSNTSKKEKTEKPSISWLSPEQNYTVTPGQQTLDLSVSVNTKDKNHLITFFYNGKAIKPPSTNTSITVTNMIRGQATFVARLTDSKTKKTIATSKPLTVHVKRAFIKRNIQ